MLLFSSVCEKNQSKLHEKAKYDLFSWLTIFLWLKGGVLSSLVWGVFADAFGRKSIILLTMLLDGVFTLISSFTQTYAVLLIFRAISGFMWVHFYSQKNKKKVNYLLNFTVDQVLYHVNWRISFDVSSFCCDSAVIYCFSTFKPLSKRQIRLLNPPIVQEFLVKHSHEFSINNVMEKVLLIKHFT